MLITGTDACAASSCSELVGRRPDPDRGGVAREDVGRVTDRLAARQLRVLGAQHHRVTAELGDSRLERGPSPGRGRLEHERDRPPVAARPSSAAPLSARRRAPTAAAARRGPARCRSGNGGASSAVYVGRSAAAGADLEPDARTLGARIGARPAGGFRPCARRLGVGCRPCCRRCRRGGRELLAQRLDCEQVSVRTSRNSLLPLRRFVAVRWPDLIKSNGGGANAILARVDRIVEHRSVRLCRWPERRWAHGVQLALRGLDRQPPRHRARS